MLTRMPEVDELCHIFVFKCCLASKRNILKCVVP